MKTTLYVLLLLLTVSTAKAQRSAHSSDGIYQLDRNIIEAASNLPALLDSLEFADLRPVESVKDIPLLFKKFYRDTHGQELWIADKDADYNCCCTVIPGLPDIQLVYFGHNDKMAVLGYIQGGFITSRYVMIFMMNAGKIIDFWEGSFHNDDEALYLPKNKDVIVKVLRDYGSKK